MKTKRMLFVHDHFFYSDANGSIFSGGAFPHFLWQKYLDHFSEIIVVGRYGGDINSNNKFVKSSCENVSFVFVDQFSSLSKLKNYSTVKHKIRELVSESDAVVVRLPSENGLLAAKLAHSLKKPYAIEVVGCAWDSLWNYGGIISKVYAPILFSRMKRAISIAPRVLYVTSGFLQSRYPSSKTAITVSASNVYLNSDDICNSYEVEKKYNTYSKDNIVFGIIANFKTKYKGLHLAIEALGNLKNSGCLSNFKLLILGNGDSSQYFKLIESNDLVDEVQFVGTIPSGKPVLKWLDNIDIYLQPSLSEGLPRSVIEAMSRGCVCVGSNVGGIPELLGGEFVFKSGSVNELSNRLKTILLLSKSELQEISLNNYKHSLNFESQLLTDVRFSFYSSLVN